MSFFYPRVISVTRPQIAQSVGATAYGGEVTANEAPIASSIPAAIQPARSGGKPEAALPADADKTYWKIIIPLGALPPGTVDTRDIVTDDASVRYQVISPYYSSLGYNLIAERLES